MDYRSKFNFPTVEDFEDLLHQNGFVIEQIYDYDRPTPSRTAPKACITGPYNFFQRDLGKLSAEQQSNVFGTDETRPQKQALEWNLLGR